MAPIESEYSMGNDEDFDVSSEDSYRISKEIENLRSQLAMKKKELKWSQENKKLRVELALKVKDVECLRKENEELKAQNKDLQNNACMLSTFKLHLLIVEMLDSQIESKSRHLQHLESWNTRLELQNAQLEEETRNLYEENCEETVSKATLEDEVHNLKVREEDHLKEIADLQKQLHICDQELKEFHERCKSLEIVMIKKNDEIDRLCKDLTAERRGKTLVEKSCAALLESFESKSAAAVKVASNAVKAFGLRGNDTQDLSKWVKSSWEALRQVSYHSGYSDAMISARNTAHSSFEQTGVQQSGVRTKADDPHTEGQHDTGTGAG